MLLLLLRLLLVLRMFLVLLLLLLPALLLWLLLRLLLLLLLLLILVLGRRRKMLRLLLVLILVVVVQLQRLIRRVRQQLLLLLLLRKLVLLRVQRPRLPVATVNVSALDRHHEGLRRARRRLRAVRARARRSLGHRRAHSAMHARTHAVRNGMHAVVRQQRAALLQTLHHRVRLVRVRVLVQRRGVVVHHERRLVRLRVLLHGEHVRGHLHRVHVLVPMRCAHPVPVRVHADWHLVLVLVLLPVPHRTAIVPRGHMPCARSPQRALAGHAGAGTAPARVRSGARFRSGGRRGGPAATSRLASDGGRAAPVALDRPIIGPAITTTSVSIRLVGRGIRASAPPVGCGLRPRHHEAGRKRLVGLVGAAIAAAPMPAILHPTGTRERPRPAAEVVGSSRVPFLQRSGAVGAKKGLWSCVR